MSPSRHRQAGIRIPGTFAGFILPVGKGDPPANSALFPASDGRLWIAPSPMASVRWRLKTGVIQARYWRDGKGSRPDFRLANYGSSSDLKWYQKT